MVVVFRTDTNKNRTNFTSFKSYVLHLIFLSDFNCIKVVINKIGHAIYIKLYKVYVFSHFTHLFNEIFTNTAGEFSTSYLNR